MTVLSSTYHQSRATTHAPESKTKAYSTKSGHVYARTVADSDTHKFSLVLAPLTESERDAIRQFCAENATTGFDFVYKGDGLTYRVIFNGAPKNTPLKGVYFSYELPLIGKLLNG